jgi:nucleoporin NUP159
MAFSFGNLNNAMMGGSSGAAGGAGGLTQGADLEVIQTEVSFTLWGGSSLRS